MSFCLCLFWLAEPCFMWMLCPFPSLVALSRGASLDHGTWSVPYLCTHRDAVEFLESCTVGSSKSPAVFVPVLSSSPQLVLSIYAFRNGHVFLLNLKQEAVRFSKHKVNAAVRYLREQRSLSRASVCCREGVREVFGAQLKGMMVKGTHSSLELAKPILLNYLALCLCD